MNRLYTLLAILAVGATASPAAAADAFFVQLDPKVSKSIGRGFSAIPQRRATPAQAGTQVMANETGRGWIIYCGCDVEIRPGKVYTVENRECKVESVDIRREGLPHIVRDEDGQRGEEVVTRCGVVPWWAVAGGAGAAVGICAVAGCFDDDDDRRRKKPVRASP